jgi:hypothetical protein
MRTILTILILLTLTIPADARRRRTYYRPLPSSGHVDDLQAWAEQEVRLMAARRTWGHCRAAPHGTFVGVGVNGRTCMAAHYGRASWRLVAEAHYAGKSCRVWRR